MAKVNHVKEILIYKMTLEISINPSAVHASHYVLIIDYMYQEYCEVLIKIDAFVTDIYLPKK